MDTRQHGIVRKQTERSLESEDGNEEHLDNNRTNNTLEMV